jgi:uncharacterized protein
MHCPIDGTQLVMTDRAGVEIDYCPQCRGVWLDRGELDKIIERTAGSAPPPPLRDGRSAAAWDGDGPGDGQDQDDPAKRPAGRRKNRAAGFLEELFDF